MDSTRKWSDRGILAGYFHGGLWHLHLAHFLCHYAMLIFPTAVIALAPAWGLSYERALSLGTPLYVAFAVFTLPAGWLGDRMDGNRLIALQLLGSGAVAIGVGLARTEWQVMACLAAIGAFAAIYHPVGLAMVTRLSGRPGKALAVNGVFGNLGLAAAMLVTGALAEAAGWRSAFVVPGVFAVGAGCVAAWAKRGRSRPGQPASLAPVATGVGVPRARQLKVLGVVLFAALFSGLIFNGVSISLPKLLDAELAGQGADLARVGEYGALVFAVAAFAQLPVGALLDRLGGRRVMIGLFLLQALALALLSRSQGIFVVPAAMTAVTLIFAGIPITGWLLGHFVESQWRARAFAAEYVLSLGVSASVVPAMAFLYAMGLGFDWQYGALVVAAFAVGCAALALPRSARHLGAAELARP